MARSTPAVAAALALALSACGEPLIVLGDAPGLMRVVIGTVDAAAPPSDTIATRTRLVDPRSVAFDAASASLYAGDRGALRQSGGLTTRVARIFRVGPDGRSIRVLDVGGCAQGPCLLEPTAMAVAPDGSLVVSDVVGNRIFRLDRGGELAVIAGTGAAASAPDGAIAAASPVHNPIGVAVGSDGRIFFSEAGSHRVRVILPNGTLGTYAGSGVAGSSGDGGAAVLARLAHPTGLALNNGMLYVADQSSHVVRAVAPGGTISTVAGIAGVEGFLGDGGPATTARLSWPHGVAVAGAALYITDRTNFRVRVVDLNTGVIRTFAGNGSRSFSGMRLTASETSIANPYGIAATASGLIFIADAGHGVVWRTSVGFD